MRAQELSYNGRPLHDFFVERAAAYVSQVRGARAGSGRCAGARPRGRSVWQPVPCVVHCVVLSWHDKSPSRGAWPGCGRGAAREAEELALAAPPNPPPPHPVPQNDLHYGELTVRHLRHAVGMLQAWLLPAATLADLWAVSGVPGATLLPLALKLAGCPTSFLPCPALLQVRETFQFAARCMSSGYKQGELPAAAPARLLLGSGWRAACASLVPLALPLTELLHIFLWIPLAPAAALLTAASPAQ